MATTKIHEIRTKKYKIDVCKKELRHGKPGEVIETIFRAIWSEEAGNFKPMFCRYCGSIYLVQSQQGDLSDPFRRTIDYLDSLYIEVDRQPETGAQTLKRAAAAMGRKGGASKSEKKTQASRDNGRLGGRPKGGRKSEKII